LNPIACRLQFESPRFANWIWIKSKSGSEGNSAFKRYNLDPSQIVFSVLAKIVLLRPKFSKLYYFSHIVFYYLKTQPVVYEYAIKTKKYMVSLGENLRRIQMIYFMRGLYFTNKLSILVYLLPLWGSFAKKFPYNPNWKG
jgi:hypothetical protein